MAKDVGPLNITIPNSKLDEWEQVYLNSTKEWEVEDAIEAYLQPFCSSSQKVDALYFSRDDINIVVNMISDPSLTRAEKWRVYCGG